MYWLPIFIILRLAAALACQGSRFASTRLDSVQFSVTNNCFFRGEFSSRRDGVVANFRELSAVGTRINNFGERDKQLEKIRNLISALRASLNG